MTTAQPQTPPARTLEGARTRARRLLSDYLIVAERGARSPAAVTARGVVLGEVGDGPAVVDGTGLTTAPTAAALVNGLAAHSIELDDTYEPASLHPGVVVWPAVLAVADEQGATLGDVLDAGIAGYDAVCGLGDRHDPKEAYGRGFHPTGICGPVGAAVGAGRLLGLEADHEGHAVGIATSAASGLLEFLSDGAWTKPLHAGQAAANGLRAARLAAAGYTGPAQAIEGRHGFLHAFGRRMSPEHADATTVPIGAGVLGTAVKLYPCCRYMHGCIDLLLSLVHEEELEASDVDVVRCGVLSAGWDLVAAPTADKVEITGQVDAQFSMPFGAALALTRGHPTLDDFERAGELAGDLRPLMTKVECYRSPQLDEPYPRAWGAEVEVRTRGGATLSRSESDFEGSPAHPPTDEVLRDKAIRLVGRDSAERVLRACVDVPDDAPLSALGRLRATDDDREVNR